MNILPRSNRCVFDYDLKKKNGWFEEAHPSARVSGVERGERVDKTMHRVLRLRRESVDPQRIQVSLQFTARCRFRRIDIS